MKKNSLNKVPGAAMFSAAVFIVVAATVAYLLPSTSVDAAALETDSAPVSVDIGNTPPAFGTAAFTESLSSVDTEVDLVAGSRKRVYCTAELTDVNGCNEITEVRAQFVHALANPPGPEVECTADADDCYQVSTTETIDGKCYAVTESGRECTGVNDTTVDYVCYADFWYWADPAFEDDVNYTAVDPEYWYWMCDMRAKDTEWGLWLSEEPLPAYVGVGWVNQLYAFDFVQPSINYGTVDLGATFERTDIALTIENMGNKKINSFDLSGTDMTCSVRGSIPVANQHYSWTPSTLYAAGTALSTNTASYVGAWTGDGDPALFNDDPFWSYKNYIYWGISMPASGLGGVCTGSTTFILVP